MSGYQLLVWLSVLQALIEEPLEITLPLLVCIGIMQANLSRRNRLTPAQQSPTRVVFGRATPLYAKYKYVLPKFFTGIFLEPSGMAV